MKYLIQSSAWIPKISRSYRLVATSVLAIVLSLLIPFPAAKGQQSGLINPDAIAWSERTGKVYTVDPAHGRVIISNDKANTENQVDVGSGPVSLAVDRQTGIVYVANAGDGTVSVLDGLTDKVAAIVNVGPHPYSIAVNSTTGHVYVSHTFNDQLTILDGATNKVDNIAMGSSDLIAINEKRDRTYLLGYEGGDLKILNGVTHTTEKATVGMHAWGMTLDPLSGDLFVAKTGYSQLAILASDSHQAKMIQTGKIPCAVAFNPLNKRLYVVNYGDDSLSVIDMTEQKTIATVSVGDRPQAVAIDLSTGRVFVANTHSDSITVIDDKSNQTIRTIAGGKHPYALVVDPTSNKLHVANLDALPTTVIDLDKFR